MLIAKRKSVAINQWKKLVLECLRALAFWNKQLKHELHVREVNTNYSQVVNFWRFYYFVRMTSFFMNISRFIFAVFRRIFCLNFLDKLKVFIFCLSKACIRKTKPASRGIRKMLQAFQETTPQVPRPTQFTKITIQQVLINVTSTPGENQRQWF